MAVDFSRVDSPILRETLNDVLTRQERAELVPE